jgi:DNA gyrase subunit A
MALKKDEAVVGVDVICAEDKARSLLVVTANGYGKRTALSLFKAQHRGGAGIKAAKTTAKNGDVVNVHIIREAEELIVISTKGQVIRVALKNISKLGRATQGVRIMKLASGDRVASITVV